MGLIERLMHDPSEEGREIAVHQFFSFMHALTLTDVTELDITDFYNMTVEEITEFEAIVATIPPGNAGILFALFTARIHTVLMLAESGDVPNYTSPAEIRTKLGI